MERLKQRYMLTQKAFASLDKAIIDFSKSNPKDPYFMALRDSLIQRFEYSVDTFWKFLKLYLIEKHGIEAVASPKAIFKACLDVKIIDNQEYSTCIKMVDDRNMSSHAYLEELAQEISSAIPTYYPVLKEIIERVSV
jgi:nucleotidyltransferase substrate binding protein (TIGR01987 family)